MGAGKALKCVARGCGFALNAKQQRRWELDAEGKRFGAGPFCSSECYHEHTRTRPGR